jgi:hypothetical protein
MIPLFKILIVMVNKIRNKFLGVHRMCIYIAYNLQNHIRNTGRETKKEIPPK